MALINFSSSLSSGLLTFVFVILHIFHSSNAQTISFTVQEELSPPVRLGNIGQEANIADRPNLEFSIISKVNYQQDLFELDTSTGDFSTASKLDRESLCGPVPKCVMTTQVAASSSTDLFTRFTVDVTVQDANDQEPEFKQDSFSLSVSENSPVDNTFLLPVAFDADFEPSFGVKGYRLMPESQTMFDLIQNQQTSGGSGGEVTVSLRLRQKLDRETKEKHVLTLVAYDGGSPANEAELRIEITVLDANDNPPVFTEKEYRFSVTEVHPVNSSVKTITAEDEDKGENGRVGYEFSIDVSPRIRNFFRIEKNSGDIILIKSLDKEGGKTLSFKVSAFDHGSPSQSSETNVVILVEDTVNDPPSIRLSPWKSQDGSAVVSESAAVGTKVAFVDVEDTDSDSSEITCSVKSDYFDMQPYKTVGVYTISVAELLDHESSAEHTVVIRCHDKGDPPKTSTAALVVKVEDSNDNPPEFSTDVYRMSVKENQEKERIVGGISATDQDTGANGELRYSIDDKVVEFLIDEMTGVIRTAVPNLDRETTSSYTFVVYAKDIGSDPKTATAMVVVAIDDLNDVWPSFDNASYRFAVSEDVDVNRIIGVVHASDRDLGPGGTVKYLMINSPLNPNPPFSVNRQDGSIVLTDQLDYETKRSYSFVVTAVDLGRPPRNSSVNVDIVVVDENDNSPVIEFPSADNLSVTLNLDLSPGHEVVKVSAHDPDSGENGRLSFSIISPNTTSSSLFWINEDTGLITLLSSLTVDDVRSYNVIISVRDNGIQQRATQAILKVDIVRSVNHLSSSQTNMTIVIIMVCVTLFVAIIVLTTLCFIKYTDKRTFYAQNKQAPKNDLHSQKGTTYSQASMDRGGDLFFDTILEGSSNFHQKQPLSSSSTSSSPSSSSRHKRSHRTISNPNTNTASLSLKNGKKSVTFDDDDVASRPGCGSSTSDVSGSNTHNDSVFLETGVSTFKPGSCPSLYKNKPSSPHHHQHPPAVVNFSNDSATSMQQLLNSSNTSVRTSSPLPVVVAQGGLKEEEQDPDTVVDYALQHHNALVRSMRGNSRRPARTRQQQQQQAARPSSNRDNTDICSSSSVETSDSGHGSELDVSVVKAAV